MGSVMGVRNLAVGNTTRYSYVMHEHYLRVHRLHMDGKDCTARFG